MSRRREAGAALAAIILAVMIAGHSVYAAFSKTTGSATNSFAAGTVQLADNDAGGALVSLSSATPGTSDSGCIKVTYSGSLSASVRLYSTVSGSLAPYVNLTVTRGTDSSPSFRSCANFAADPTDYLGSGTGVIYSGTLSAFPTSYATGIVDASVGSPATWNTNSAHSYKFTVMLANNNAAQGLSASADFQWEARNQ